MAQIVFGAMKRRRVSQADIGRAMETGTTPRHNIKRVSRLVTNGRVNVAEGRRGPVRTAAKASGGCLVVAVDRVDVGRFEVLKAAVPLGGRAVPILFAAYPKWRLKRGQDRFEEAFLDLLSGLPPAGSWTIIVADRGFARAELVTKLGELEMNRVIRVSSGATYGWGPRSTRAGSRERLARLLLVLAFAYPLLVTMGLLRRDTMSEAHRASASAKSNDRARGFTIGRSMPTRAKWRLAVVLEALERMPTGWVEENWG